MKISIVTLSFNQSRFLKEAMDSVVGQHYPELEYIVVDPGSTDGSRELIQSYGCAIARTLFEPDEGAADGLNRGFALASGEVFGILNADDLLRPGSLQAVAEFFAANPSCDIAFGNGHIVDASGVAQRHYKARDFSVRTYFYGGARWLQQSTFFRRGAYLASPRFNVRNRTCWDGELIVTMVSRGARVGYIDADLAAFRIHDASITGTGRLTEAYVRDSKQTFERIYGRSWGTRDEVFRLFYRLKGAVAEIAMR